MIKSRLYYCLGMAATYVAAFAYVAAVPFLAAIMIAWSYFILINSKSLLPVIALIIYARSMVGFIADGNTTIYTAMNIAVNYTPTLIYFILNMKSRRSDFLIKNYKISILYACVLIFYSAVSGYDFIYVLGDRILPFFMILLLVGREDPGTFNNNFAYVMRFTVLSAIFAEITPEYTSIGHELLRNGTIFGSESITSLYLGVIPRATGPVWDPRILGILCFLNIYIHFSSKKEPISFDIIISIIGVAASLSRGSIMATGVLIAFFLVSRRSTYGIMTLLMLCLTSLFAFKFMVKYIFDRIFIVGGANPISQRFDFFMYAIDQFMKNPLGIGVGKLRAVSDIVIVSNSSYDTVTDAYLAIILAELGVFGFIIFILSFKEIFWGDNKLSFAVFLAFVFQMIGTDIPDFGPYYLVIALVGAAGAKTTKLSLKNYRHA